MRMQLCREKATSHYFDFCSLYREIFFLSGMSARGRDFVFFQSAKLQNTTIFILVGTNIYHCRKALKPNQTEKMTVIFTMPH